jgi:hypothetical protein
MPRDAASSSFGWATWGWEGSCDMIHCPQMSQINADNTGLMYFAPAEESRRFRQFLLLICDHLRHLRTNQIGARLLAVNFVLFRQQS